MWYVLIMWSGLSGVWLVCSPHAHYDSKIINQVWLRGNYRLHHQYIWRQTSIPPQTPSVMTAAMFMCPLRWIILTHDVTVCVAKLLIFIIFLFLSGDWDNVHRLQHPLRDRNCCRGQTRSFTLSVDSAPQIHTGLTISVHLTNHLKSGDTNLCSSWTRDQKVNFNY